MASGVPLRQVKLREEATSKKEKKCGGEKIGRKKEASRTAKLSESQDVHNDENERSHEVITLARGGGERCESSTESGDKRAN